MNAWLETCTIGKLTRCEPLKKVCARKNVKNARKIISQGTSTPNFQPTPKYGYIVTVSAPRCSRGADGKTRRKRNNTSLIDAKG